MCNHGYQSFQINQTQYLALHWHDGSQSTLKSFMSVNHLSYYPNTDWNHFSTAEDLKLSKREMANISDCQRYFISQNRARMLNSWRGLQVSDVRKVGVTETRRVLHEVGVDLESCSCAGILQSNTNYKGVFCKACS